MREVEGRGNFLPRVFLRPSLPFCSHPNSQVTKTPFLPFLPGSLSFFSFSASRIGSSTTCRIRAYLINSDFNFIEEFCSRCEGLRNERDSARRENQTLEEEIQVFKNISEDNQRKSQALQKILDSVKEEQGNLLSSENLEAAKKEQQEKIRRCQREVEKLQDKVTKKTSEFEKKLAHEQQLKKKLEEKFQAGTKAKDILLEQMSVENERLIEEGNAERSKCYDLRKEGRRLREMAGRKCFE